MTEQVKVTQADREFAAQIMELQEEWEMADLIRAGERDNGNTVQAAARHRIAAQAELLEALEFLANAARATKGFASPMALQQADAAIAKAKGEA